MLKNKFKRRVKTAKEDINIFHMIIFGDISNMIPNLPLTACLSVATLMGQNFQYF